MLRLFQETQEIYAGAADTGYQVWVDFEKVDASNVDDYLN